VAGERRGSVKKERGKKKEKRKVCKNHKNKETEFPNITKCAV